MAQIQVTASGTSLATAQTIYTVPGTRILYVSAFSLTFNLAPAVGTFLALFGSIQGFVFPVEFNVDSLIGAPAKPYLFLPGENVQIVSTAAPSSWRGTIMGHLI